MMATPASLKNAGSPNSSPDKPGRARQPTQRLSDLVDAGKTYAKPTKKNAAEAPTPEKPAAPASAFVFFGRATRDEIKAQHADWSLGDVGRELSRRWKTLDEDQQRPFRALERADAARCRSPLKKRRIQPRPLKPPRVAAGGAAARPLAAAPRPLAAAPRPAKKRPGPRLDSLASLPCPGTKKAPARVKPRPFLDTKRCTRPAGPRVVRKRAPPVLSKPSKVEALAGRVLYASDDESVGSKSGDDSDDNSARSTGSLDDWIVADDACARGDDEPGFSAEARWAIEGAGLLRELYARPARPRGRPATPPPAPKAASVAFHASSAGASAAGW